MNTKKGIKLPDDCKKACWECNKYKDCKNLLRFYITEKNGKIQICKECYSKKEKNND